MKKIVIVMAMLVVLASLVTAQNIDLGKFPKGKWLDANWSAVWEFSADNIRILDTNGAALYDFKGKIADFKVDVGLTEATISFTCADSNRSYVFTKGIKDLDLNMEINPVWTDKNYKVTMAFQK